MSGGMIAADARNTLPTPSAEGSTYWGEALCHTSCQIITAIPHYLIHTYDVQSVRSKLPPPLYVYAKDCCGRRVPSSASFSPHAIAYLLWPSLVLCLIF